MSTNHTIPASIEADALQRIDFLLALISQAQTQIGQQRVEDYQRVQPRYRGCASRLNLYLPGLNPSQHIECASRVRSYQRLIVQVFARLAAVMFFWCHLRACHLGYTRY